MARNKYPEVTVEKILEVSQRLFMEKGYDDTTIQDIVNELGGLTKGAIYHHFKSKEEIMDALGEKMFFDNNPFTIVKQRKELNGLQKMREVIKINHADVDRAEISKHSLPVLKNPRILAGMIDTDRRLIAPLWLALIEEGQRDGSIHTHYAKELSELLPLLTNLWLAPSVYPASAVEIMNKFLCICTMLEAMGVPLIDDEIKELADHYFKEIVAAE
ncbi:TetR/AcrR family transcriptional regulator [Bariatricus massiliensis]|uniref:TetR/AcrR family transcriptional regulator n=1 Tax=Bariatricus massiliensis TaxID=1745713 RepID=A0ABS8DBG5_9FIRM|nr:TetR/AcrR family transcriptional regulator [Bariatricus massiliensis]MCB7303676.1 TetR/AcrR family transcriptional regulator [Bariatricus massiliensis]MCB7373092.1 TetR/AcrR family transcriptional regulator [Bariatricus massiliensis]MCB7385762.1 TetR/AcrR family transcriptional regulator [Bariatricus massiliensis]MCB7409924.1 TetR/AcrR family transcriptional regulator [Bariatricus massiliensis]MCQ5253107.1 TetR/AcrR family transcriptional regulator [Bariatricus massiliensis]